MKHQPDPSDPQAYLPWICYLNMKVKNILVVVLSDNTTRSLILRNIARQLGVPYLPCRRIRSTKQFLEFMAKSLSVEIGKSNTGNVWLLLEKYLKDNCQAVILDNAEQLTPSAMKAILHFHKKDEHIHQEYPFILASGQRHLLQVIEAVDSGEYFTGHCMYYIPDCKPTKRMIAYNEMVDSITDRIESPIIRFPGHHEET